MKSFLLILLFIIIIICTLLSYRIETFKDNVGTVINTKINPPSLDVYNCYNYIKTKFPNWNVDNYSKGELKVLGTLRTGLNPTYQPGTLETNYTNSCVLPDEHSFIYSTNAANNMSIPSVPLKSQKTHVLPKNVLNGVENPYGYKIDFSQPNQFTGIDYTIENNFRDLLKGSYEIMDSTFLYTINTLSNQLWVKPGLSNIFVNYLTIQIPTNTALLNNSIRQFKPTCLLDLYSDKLPFKTECDQFNLLNTENKCCDPNSICLKALRMNAKLTICINENNNSINSMKTAIDQIKNANINKEITQLQNALNKFKNNVIFYKDCEFKGDSSVRGEGSYTMDGMGIANDLISSIRIPKGFYVKLFADPNYAGDNIILIEDISCLVSNNWNDKVSSFIIRNSPFPIPIPIPPPMPAPAPTPSLPPDYSKLKASFYEHPGFQGQSVTVGIGRYADMAGLKDNTISSVKVPQGLKVILYGNPNFISPAITLTGDVWDLSSMPIAGQNGANWNDQASSFDVLLASSADPPPTLKSMPPPPVIVKAVEVAPPPPPPPPPPPEPTYNSAMSSKGNNTMYPGAKLVSPNKKYAFVMQNDNKAVIYGPQGAMWWTSTPSSFLGRSRTAKSIRMEDNGNLVLYDTSDQAMWKCCDYDGGYTAPYTITMRDDGNLIITDRNNNTRWQSKDWYGK
jgi:hypothetical protein